MDCIYTIGRFDPIIYALATTLATLCNTSTMRTECGEKDSHSRILRRKAYRTLCQRCDHHGCGMVPVSEMVGKARRRERDEERKWKEINLKSMQFHLLAQFTLFASIHIDRQRA